MRVGTRQDTTKVTPRREDHPHACGDKFEELPAEMTNTGSSPCVWGQVVLQSGFDEAVRIIPMRVGTSDQLAEYYDFLKDHPHACGDKNNSETEILSR